MRKDINFFSGLEQKQLEQKRKSGRILTISLGIGLFIIGIYGFLGVKLFDLNQSLKQGEQFFNSAAVKEKLAFIQAKKDRIANLRQYEAGIDTALNKIASTNRVNSNFFDTFAKNLPPSVSISYLKVSEAELMLEGTAPLWPPIAELAHNMEQTGLFAKVQIISVAKKKDGPLYDFSIVGDLKAVVR